MDRGLLQTVLITLVVVVPLRLSAGTMTVGAKYWQAWWISGYGEPLADAAMQQLGRYIKVRAQQEYINAGQNPTTIQFSYDYDLDVKTGNGFLTGPVFGYSTDDKQWQFSVAVMGFSSFTQDSEATMKYSYTNPPSPISSSQSGDVKSTIKTKRYETDVSARYALTDWFGAFIGYKYQYLEAEYHVDMNLPMAIAGDRTVFRDKRLVSVSSTAHTPSIGLTVNINAVEQLYLGLQAGALFPIPKVFFYKALDVNEDKYTASTTGTRFHAQVRTTVGFASEIGLSYVFAQSVVVQLGVKYQYMTIQLESVELGDSTEYRANDNIYGVTLAAVYALKI